MISEEEKKKKRKKQVIIINDDEEEECIEQIPLPEAEIRLHNNTIAVYQELERVLNEEAKIVLKEELKNVFKRKYLTYLYQYINIR